MLAKANPTPGQLVLASQEGLRKTVAGAVRDIQLQHKEPWGFDLSEIKHDKMFLWHGVNDTIVPIQVAEYTCKKVPTVRCFFEEHVGHTVILPKFEEILSTILKGRSPRTCDGPVCKV
jgi:predicted esterase